jgi:hypothetical protein
MWEPGVDVRIRRFLHLDVAALRRETRLPVGHPIAVSVSWHASARSSMRQPASHTVVDGVDTDVRLDVVLPGNLVFGKLKIRTSVVLGESWDAPRGVARDAGSVLMEDVVDVVLQGSATLFPTTVVDFAHAGLDPEASWYLSVRDDLEGPFTGTVLLQINKQDAVLTRAISNERRSAMDTHVVDEVYVGVAKVLLRWALEKRDAGLLGEVGDYESDMLGSVLAELANASSVKRGDFAAEGGLNISEREMRLSASVRRRGLGRNW